MANSSYQRSVAAALACAVLGCAASWYWADRLYRAGARVRGYWIAVAGTALQALVLAACALWLHTKGSGAAKAPRIAWLMPALWLSVALLGFMVAFQAL